MNDPVVAFFLGAAVGILLMLFIEDYFHKK